MQQIINESINHFEIMNRVIVAYIQSIYPTKVEYYSEEKLFSFDLPFLEPGKRKDFIPARKLKFHTDANWILFVTDLISLEDLDEEEDVNVRFHQCIISTPEYYIDIIDTSTVMAAFKAAYEFIRIKLGMGHIEFRNDVGDYFDTNTNSLVDQQFTGNDRTKRS